jgi:RimJ/RimL family protein N-acetyltransferase
MKPPAAPFSPEGVLLPTESLWEGTSVRLRGFASTDWEYFRRFETSSADARAVYRVVPPRHPEAHRRESEELAGRSTGEEEFALAVEETAGNEIVGALSTYSIDRRAGRFTYGIAIDRFQRRRGFAREAVTILLDYMFDERRFHKCEAEIHADNDASLALHERLGFSQEGRLRDHEYFRGSYRDVIVMGITAPEHRRRRA